MKRYFLTLVFGLIPMFAADIVNGERIYKSTCAFCHSTRMTGGMGRDFNLVSYTRTQEQIKLQIGNPEKSAFLLGYTSNAMPNFLLGKDDIEDVAAFIDALQPIKHPSIRSDILSESIKKKTE